MKRCFILLVLAPVPAWAMTGRTVLEGPAVPVLETVGRDFPRYDLTELCKIAMPGTDFRAEVARETCAAQQARLAGLASWTWDMLPAQARHACIERADAARGRRYYVLYACVKAARFRIDRTETIGRVAERIARQNRKVPAPFEPQKVGSIQ